MSTISEKSEILFLYESKYSMPNGDPFTGEQRYDEESKRILVSDVRIKRFIRDYLLELEYEIFVVNDKSQIASGAESGAASRLNALIEKYKDDTTIVLKEETPEPAQTELPLEVETTDTGKGKKGKSKAKKGPSIDVLKLLQKCIDVRLFGGISTKEGMAVNLTGPVQFALLNPALNKSDLRIHQNTSVFSSSAEKTRGAIGTTSVVPYSVCQIHGWVNPFSAKHSGLEQADLDKMFAALWHSVNNANTRSKSNQSSVLLVQIVYNNVTDKLYGTDKLISISTQLKDKNGVVISDKEDEQLRDWNDFTLSLDKLKTAAESPKVKAINYYTENDDLEKNMPKNDKFKKMTLVSLTKKEQS
ncbi:MAG: type I-B CRISPR-associated protein Cas7/Csh2 [Saprospiraceae bacterium]